MIAISRKPIPKVLIDVQNKYGESLRNAIEICNKSGQKSLVEYIDELKKIQGHYNSSALKRYLVEM